MPSVGANDGKQDSVTGLTARHKRALASSWSLVNAEPEKHGVELLIRLFDANPKTQNYFARFKCLKDEELRTNPDLISHAVNVMKGVTHIVNNLDNADVLVDTIITVAHDHRDLGVNSQDFKMLLVLLQDLMKDKLKEVYDVYTAKSWTICCDAIWSIVDSEMKK